MGPSQPTSERAQNPLIGGGRYELLHELAAGGMATVYIARSRGAAGFERVVAIKCCHKHLREDEEFAAMFLDEAQLVSELHHSNVVSTLDFGEDPEYSLFIVMEFVDGFSLQQVLRAAKHKGAPMPPAVALRVMIDTLSGLHAAHEHKSRDGAPLNIVHRDVSPQNVLVGIDGVSRIMDFGIARAEGRIAHTREGAIKGKLAYMPPEQHGLLSDKQHAVTARADVFAAAVVLWEALAGDKLFQRGSDAQTLRAAMTCEVPALSGRVEGVTAALDRAIAKAIQRDPDERFESAQAFVEALEASGVEAASTREVSRWVRSVLGAHIEARHKLLRKLAESARTESSRAMLAARAGAGDVTPAPAPAPVAEAERKARAITVPAPPMPATHEDVLPPEAPRFRTSVAPPKESSPPRALPWAAVLAMLALTATALAATVVFRASRSAPAIEPVREAAVLAPNASEATTAGERAPSMRVPAEALVPEVRSAVVREATVPDAGASTLRRRPGLRTPQRAPQTAPFRPRFL